uniref:IQ calmodulin-binding motif domain-containing protein n=1 Tax=Chromera velia CCMP2878 TaxID=1169474 RepID=A0A0G4HLX9_9ALVE|eukprot:Cvel_28943.t1-p1 / transcript=Cvel_28943.t1 / gene=Cvel_28943 / organism=Chromera_velia_CCMP2878 / gene_product=hypothetical protein / transcript_product=hypothetical protein / location=Cvel_scaffold3879:4294-10914(-) / protein_length=1014 / sequence_SO=supercontig / SO=protein_coding / is_pseudo=false
MVLVAHDPSLSQSPPWASDPEAPKGDKLHGAVEALPPIVGASASPPTSKVQGKFGTGATDMDGQSTHFEGIGEAPAKTKSGNKGKDRKQKEGLKSHTTFAGRCVQGAGGGTVRVRCLPLHKSKTEEPRLQQQTLRQTRQLYLKALQRKEAEAQAEAEARRIALEKSRVPLRAVLHVQRHVRGFLARRRFRPLVNARVEVAALKRGRAELDSCVKGMRSSLCVVTDKKRVQHYFATVLTRHARGFLARRRAQQRKEALDSQKEWEKQNEAARKIQGLAVRARARRLKREREEEDARRREEEATERQLRQDWAASVLQRKFRQALAAVHLAALRKVHVGAAREAARKRAEGGTIRSLRTRTLTNNPSSSVPLNANNANSSASSVPMPAMASSREGSQRDPGRRPGPGHGHTPPTAAGGSRRVHGGMSRGGESRPSSESKFHADEMGVDALPLAGFNFQSLSPERQRETGKQSAEESRENSPPAWGKEGEKRPQSSDNLEEGESPPPFLPPVAPPSGTCSASVQRERDRAMTHASREREKVPNSGSRSALSSERDKEKVFTPIAPQLASMNSVNHTRMLDRMDNAGGGGSNKESSANSRATSGSRDRDKHQHPKEKLPFLNPGVGGGMSLMAFLDDADDKGKEDADFWGTRPTSSSRGRTGEGERGELSSKEKAKRTSHLSSKKKSLAHSSAASSAATAPKRSSIQVEKEKEKRRGRLTDRPINSKEKDRITPLPPLTDRPTARGRRQQHENAKQAVAGGRGKNQNPQLPAAPCPNCQKTAANGRSKQQRNAKVKKKREEKYKSKIRGEWMGGALLGTNPFADDSDTEVPRCESDRSRAAGGAGGWKRGGRSSAPSEADSVGGEDAEGREGALVSHDSEREEGEEHDSSRDAAARHRTHSNERQQPVDPRDLEAAVNALFPVDDAELITQAADRAMGVVTSDRLDSQGARMESPHPRGGAVNPQPEESVDETAATAVHPLLHFGGTVFAPQPNAAVGLSVSCVCQVSGERIVDELFG